MDANWAASARDADNCAHIADSAVPRVSPWTSGLRLCRGPRPKVLAFDCPRLRSCIPAEKRMCVTTSVTNSRRTEIHLPLPRCRRPCSNRLPDMSKMWERFLATTRLHREDTRGHDCFRRVKVGHPITPTVSSSLDCFEFSIPADSQCLGRF
jgi:hypothetical protein